MIVKKNMKMKMQMKMRKKMKRAVEPESEPEYNELPRDCVVKILSMMPSLTAKDVCRFGSVSTMFRAVADNDSVWEKLLPPGYEDLISRSRNFPVEILREMPKKALYFLLCANQIVIDDEYLSFSLDKTTGKKSFFLGRKRFVKKRDVFLSDDEKQAIPESSRFYEIAALAVLTVYRISANIDPKLLSPWTTYKAYLIFKIGYSTHTFSTTLSKLRVSFKAPGQIDHWVNRDGKPVVRYFEPRDNVPRVPVQRRDGTKEVEINTFFNLEGEGLPPVVCLVDEYLWTRRKNSGIILMGVEFRPVD